VDRTLFKNTSLDDPKIFLTNLSAKLFTAMMTSLGTQAASLRVFICSGHAGWQPAYPTD